MTSVQFCYWLQGYFELTSVTTGFTAEQAGSVKRHLAMVFVHEIDPSHGDTAEQTKLDAAHQGMVEEMKKQMKAEAKAILKNVIPTGDPIIRC